jgi:flagellar secretion chaperone FliS
MTLTETTLSYRKSAIGGASTVGLMIVLFDTLVGDFRRAAAALRKNDIETRCRELNHAALVLGQLEDWLDREKGGESAKTLSRFYALLRAKMLEAGATKSAKVLEAQIDTILHIRTAWQSFEESPLDPSRGIEEATEPQTAPDASSPAQPSSERISFSFSA